MHKMLLPIAFLLSAAIAITQGQAAVPDAQPAAAAAPPTSAAAAPATSEQPASAPGAGQVSLAANSDIPVTVTAPLKSGKAKVGSVFNIVTTADTVQDGVVVIPQGTEGEGRVTFSKGGGSFGKSGQMELAFVSLSLNGQTIALQGKYREQAGGNSGAATGAVVAGGLIGGFLVHGHSVEVLPGKVMHAQNIEAVTVNVPAVAPNVATVSPEPAKSN